MHLCRSQFRLCSKLWCPKKFGNGAFDNKTTQNQTQTNPTLLSPVRQSEGEELQTGGLEEEVHVGFAQLVDAGDAVAETPDHLKRRKLHTAILDELNT